MFSSFVDTHDPLFIRALDEEREVDYGWPVKILRGKHAGKTGRVVVVEREYIRVLEDVTDIEVSTQLIMMNRT